MRSANKQSFPETTYRELTREEVLLVARRVLIRGPIEALHLVVEHRFEAQLELGLLWRDPLRELQGELLPASVQCRGEVDFWKTMGPVRV